MASEEPKRTSEGPCTRNVWADPVGLPCPDCGHASALHPGAAKVAHCPHCEVEALVAKLKNLIGDKT